MVDLKSAKKWALQFEGSEEQPHFEKASFRIKKKIFLTLDVANQRACVKLSEVDQSVFASYDPAVIYPVPNKWGKQGWTLVELKKVPAALFKDVLNSAYCEVAPKTLAAKYKKD